MYERKPVENLIENQIQEMPERMTLESLDIAAEKREQLKQLFPEVFNEDKVDFERLQRVLGEQIDTGRERYGLTWPGKAECMKVIQEPSRATLKPCREESVNFDDTENLFIEGDNLEVLKLLQKSYCGKVKMIYIDPPYNTGKEFIYPDNFKESIETYLAYAGLVDANGKKFTTNTATEGRFHSKWLNMMYPRLYLAKNLLREDGVICISIDDNELQNLRRVCDEIFGEENFEGHIHWRRRHNQPNDPTKMIGLVAEHIIVYAKNKPLLKDVGVGKIGLTGDFSNPDNDHRGDWASKPWKAGSDQSGSRYSITTPTGTVHDQEWMGDKITFDQLLNDGRIIFPNSGEGSPRKKYFKFEREEEGQCATNWWSHDHFGHNQEGNSILTDLMDGIKNTFSNPKPPKLVSSLMSIANCKENDLIIDFFAGSGTTFQAADEYPKNVKVICVQLPERLDASIKEHRPAIEFCRKNKLTFVLSEVAKERVRRICKKSQTPGAGVRIFKLDKSHFNQWQSEVERGNVEQLQANLELHSSHIAQETQQEDLLYELLLKAGFSLTESIEQKTLGNQTVFSAVEGTLLICLENTIEPETIEKMVEAKPAEIIVKDSAFAGNDQLKVNAVQTVKAYNRNSETDIVFKVV